MARIIISQLALLAACYIVYRLISSFVTKRRFRAFAAQNDCTEPLDVSGPFPYGVARIRRILCVHAWEIALDKILISGQESENIGRRLSGRHCGGGF